MVIRRIISCPGTFFIQPYQTKFYHAIEAVDSPIRKNKKAYLFLPPWEDHDFALLYSHMILKGKWF